jgi:hypothetical protein
MTGNYYYLVAGLPDLFLDEGKQPLSCIESISEIREQLSGCDAGLFSFLQYPFDNRNLVSLLTENSDVFDARGYFTEEELTASLKVPEDLPGYMQLFLEAHGENRSPQQGLTPEDRLAWFFYEEACDNANTFIREWFTFDRNLRNVIAGINCRKELSHLDELGTDRDKAASALVVGRDEVAEAVMRSNAADFGIASQFPYVERVVALARKDVQEFEKGIDNLRWEMLDEMTTFSYFGAETVFAFFIKLTIVERWMALDPETGKEKRDRLLEELMASYTVPREF